MTVVAYRDGVMAADSAVFLDGAISGHVRKIARSSAGHIGAGAGDSGVTFRFRKWITKGAKGKFSPGGDFIGLLVMPDGDVMHVSETGDIYSCDAEWHALGAGGTFALGAMAAGASASQAVHLAITHLTHAGGVVQSERLGRRV